MQSHNHNNSNHDPKKKFLFDLNNFDEPDTPEVEEEEEVEEDLPPPPPTFSEEELDAAKTVSFETGRRKGVQEEKESREQYVTDILKNIAENFSTLFANEIYRERQYEEESLKLALEILSLVAPSLQNRLGKEALRDALLKVLQNQSGQSEIRIEVHPDTASDIDALIAQIWPDPEDAPRYKVVADSTLDSGACALSWQDGGMIRDPNQSVNDIKEIIEQLLVEQVMSKSNSDLTPGSNNAIKEDEESNG
ncbi:MAG: hypothetical protein MRY79_04085 [Alphaproteobacteria bacterium]|nr:hypothetical protein [Alphaproteobacteria bacterium]